ncbi:hypothetical protein GCM10028857_28490 [Salinarchaeum chitinilyticum]
MSTPDSQPADGARSDDRVERRAELARALARGGMEGVQVVSLETAAFALTPKRLELIQTIRSEAVESVRDLASRVGRDPGQVSRDLAALAERGIVEYEESGRAKRPVLVQEHVVVEPI